MQRPPHATRCVGVDLGMDSCMLTVDLTPPPPIISLKFTAQQFYSHGDGVPPASRDDSNEARENRRVDVVPHVVVVVAVSFESLEREKDVV